MAHPLTGFDDRSTDYLTSGYSNHPPVDDFKSYDDLIDQYAEPYSRVSRHQTFKIQTPVDDVESRGPSYSLDHKSVYPSGKPHDETEDFPARAQSYPPNTNREQLVDHRKWWQQVSARLPSPHGTSTHPSQILPDSWACRLFVITVLVETTIDLAIEADLLVRLQNSLKMPVYLSVFALAQYGPLFSLFSMF